jgi:dienelactone hydrolase
MLSSELSKGTLTIILTKGLSRRAVILAKLTSASLIWTGCYWLSFFISWGYTVYYFPDDKLPYIMLAGFCLWLFGLFLLALTALAAAITETSTIFCLLLVGAAVIVLNLLNMIPYVKRYNPVTLAGVPTSLLADTATPRGAAYAAMVVAVGATGALVALAIMVFNKRKAPKTAIAVAGGFAVLLALTILVNEEVPARIALARYVVTEKVTVGAGTEWELQGLLTLPKNANGLVPAVVLVQGSGASDMNERIYDNQPFREIAEYLSKNGIAVIRYNKRTYTYGYKMSQADLSGMTVWDETMEDAILATEILKSDPRIDETKVFILGHSMGGMLAPRIHALGGDYAGLILFAGSPRFLFDIMIEQMEASIAEMKDGADKETAEAGLAAMKDGLGEIMALSDEEAKAVMVEGAGASAYYFKDLYDHPIAGYIAETTVPFLVLHGDADLQVDTVRDFNLYKELLADHDNATFILYDGLNHLFMPARVDKISELMDDYRVKSRIEEKVLRDIVEWVTP